jgi:hypothetical protein
MEVTFEHEIHFSNKSHLLLTDVAKSLLALDRNAKAAPVALEKLFDDVRASDIELYLDNLQTGSLTEKLKFRLKFALQHHIEKNSGLPLGKLSKQPKEKQEQIAAWLFAAVLLIGLREGSELLKARRGKPNLDQQINIILHQGQEITGIEKNTLNGAIDEALHETPGSISGAIDFARPAKKDPNASITLNRHQFLSRESLAEIPSSVQEEQTEKSVDLHNTLILIRATDRDSGKKGWGATIPEFSDGRMRVTVAPGINLDVLAHQDSAIGNVTIFYTTDNSGNVVKKHAHIFSIGTDKRAL